MKNKILIVSGDPNSINSEIIYKSWKNLKANTKKKIFFISNYLLLKKQFKKLKYKINLMRVKNIDNNCFNNSLKVLDVPLRFVDPFNVPYKSSVKFVKNSLNLAHSLAIKKKVNGIINCPIDKKLLKKKNSGITEYLASKCKIKNGSEVMLIKGKKLSVIPVTTHIQLKDVSKKIKSDLIIKKIITYYKWFKLTYKRNPNIGILGLNPHNAELTKNSEEYRIIIPAIKKIKKRGYKIKGPLVADTVFINDYKNYDVIIGMYHDQVLAPFKTIFKFDAINVTLGLKYPRLSPDHGTAKDILKKKIANPSSLIRCIEFLSKLK
mgnify:CR=1 FL=1|tara:strand:+ start:184 stop:1146 length:963 start_codon:yes stop_codon:yes gene_type:complete